MNYERQLSVEELLLHPYLNREVPIPGTNGTRPVVERVGDCLIWLGSRTKGNHALGHRGPAYRIFYKKVIGPIPHGCHLHHWCEGGGMCLNPYHAIPLTPRAHLDADRVIGRRKLCRADVVAIVRLLEDRVPQAEIARQFGISSGYISMLNCELRWPDVVSAERVRLRAA